ncbi:hypothetical protein [Ekhidna sp.]|uniref:hypothetical protein n=1 Tax=Ekhidna sp. TaxID=2608089 RepID=UPI0032995D43
MRNLTGFISIFLTLATPQFVSGQNYSDCILLKNEIINPDILNERINRRIKDLKPDEEIVLNEKLIDDGRLIKSPFQDYDPGNLNHLKGIELTFVRYQNQEVVVKDKSGKLHYVYLNGYNRDLDIAVSLSVRKEKELIEIEPALVGRRVILNDENLYELYQPKIHSIIHLIKYNPERDRFYLLLKEFNPDGSEKDGYVGYPIADKRFGLLDYDCFIQKFRNHISTYTALLEEKFTEKEIENIKRGTIFIGMSEEAVPHVLGYPSETNTTVTELGTSKQLIYGDGIYVYILDGKVSAYQNLESLKDF